MPSREAFVDTGPTSEPARLPRVVQLIPGEHYLVVFGTDPGDFPDEDTVEELQVLAYARRNKSTLGLATAQVVPILAETVSAGILTNAIWAQCQAAARYVRHHRAKDKGAPLKDPEEVAKRAMEVMECPALPVSPPATMAHIKISDPGGSCWEATVQADGRPVRLHLEATGGIIDVIIGR